MFASYKQTNWFWSPMFGGVLGGRAFARWSLCVIGLFLTKGGIHWKELVLVILEGEWLAITWTWPKQGEIISSEQPPKHRENTWEPRFDANIPHRTSGEKHRGGEERNPWQRVGYVICFWKFWSSSWRQSTSGCCLFRRRRGWGSTHCLQVSSSPCVSFWPPLPRERV